ncbi:MAG: hypothetical protein Q4P29_03460 [Tissierellia bacterium]|nr:hypothetical protein [Tissierellia bacterium]
MVLIPNEYLENKDNQNRVREIVEKYFGMDSYGTENRFETCKTELNKIGEHFIARNLESLL